MKVKDFKEEVKMLGSDELRTKLEMTRRELFSLRLNSSTAHVKDYSQYKKLRKNIARIESYLRQKQS